MTSHIVFDSSYVGDTWDWLESILIMVVSELWYDPTLWHSHLRELFYWVCSHSTWYIALGSTPFLLKGCFFRWPLCRGILLSIDDGFFSHGYHLEEIIHFFFTLEHETWLVYFSGVPYTGAYPSQHWWFFRHSCSLEVIEFLSHWSTRYNWVISLMWL